MNVLAVTPNYPPGSRVGAWLCTHLFLRHLVGAGHTVTAFAYRSRERWWSLDGVHVETGLRGRSYGATLARAADVVVSHAGDGGVGLEVASAAGRPAVRMVHGHGTDGIGAPALTVFNSHHLLAASGHTGPAIVCHPPVDIDRWAAVDRKGAPATTLIGLSEAKGVKTAWRLAEALPGRPFLGVRGGYGQQVEPRARNFEVLPTTRDMRPVYARTRVLLAPSAEESWCMAAVEAIAAGIPVIAHPAPGLLESLGDAGTFVDRDDTAGWVTALEALDDPATYAAASARARRRAAELHPDAALEGFAAALEALAGVPAT